MEFIKETSRWGTDCTIFLTTFCVTCRPFLTVRSTASATRCCLMLLSQSNRKQKTVTTRLHTEFVNHGHVYTGSFKDEGRETSYSRFSRTIVVVCDKTLITNPDAANKRCHRLPLASFGLSPSQGFFVYKKKGSPSGCVAMERTLLFFLVGCFTGFFINQASGSLAHAILRVDF